jgi:hypothetical protein
MTSPDQGRERLAQRMDDRRTELRLNWEDVARDGNLSIRVLNDLRRGATKPRRNTLRGVDVGLQWLPGSAERILDGGEPAPADIPPPPPDRGRPDDDSDSPMAVVRLFRDLMDTYDRLTVEDPDAARRMVEEWRERLERIKRLRRENERQARNSA